MLTVAAADTRPLESVTVAVKVTVPELFRNPVVKRGCRTAVPAARNGVGRDRGAVTSRRPIDGQR